MDNTTKRNNLSENKIIKEKKQWKFVCSTCENLNERFSYKTTDNLFLELEDFKNFKKEMKSNDVQTNNNLTEEQPNSSINFNEFSNNNLENMFSQFEKTLLESELYESNQFLKLNDSKSESEFKSDEKQQNAKTDDHVHNHMKHDHSKKEKEISKQNDHNHNHKQNGHSANHDQNGHNENHNQNGHNHEKTKQPLIKLIIGAIFLLPFLYLLIFSLTNNVAGPVTEFFQNPWFQFFDATIVMGLIGTIFWKETIHDAKNKKLSVDVLVSLSSTMTYIFSIIFLILMQTGVVDEVILFFSATVEILVIIFAGRYLEDYIKNKALVEIDEFMDLIPNKANLIKENRILEIDSDQLNLDDIVLVRKGEKIPTDGIIIEGNSIVLEQSFTGESNNFDKTINDFVLGGTISSTGNLKIKVTKTLKNSVIYQIVEGINQTSNYRPETQKVADKFAAFLIPFAFITSILALIIWGTIYSLNGETNSWYSAFEIMITIMVITCPCSLGLATPTSILVSSSVASRLGIYYNSKDVFESFKKIDCIVMDKTGTITTGEVNFIETNLDEEKIKLIFEVEKNFTHPLAKSIINQFEKEFGKREFDFESLTYEEVPSLGVSFAYKTTEYYFGSEKFIQTKIDVFTLEENVLNFQKNGSIVLFLFNSTEILGYIVLGDVIKKTSKEAIAKFKEQNIDVYMITGDNVKTAEYIADLVGIDKSHVYSETMPQDKQEIIKKLQDQNKFVLFVGDGNNDALGMKQADLSISMNSGTDLAIKLSDVTILENDLDKINDVIYLTHKTLFNIYRGLYISIGYNFAAIPLAASGFINPFIAAFLMMLSDTIAIFNAITLRFILFKQKYRKSNQKK